MPAVTIGEPSKSLETLYAAVKKSQKTVSGICPSTYSEDDQIT
jgi:hypothetical protein